MAFEDRKRRSPVPTGERAEVHAAGAVGAYAGLVAALLAPDPTVPSAALAVAAPLISYGAGLVGRAVARVGQRRLFKFWQQVLGEEAHGSEDADRERLQEFMGRPGSEDLLHQAFRKLMDALDDAATPVIANLVVHYERGGRLPDPFFRGMGGLLADAAAADLQSLGLLMESLAQHGGTDDRGTADQITAHLVGYDATQRLRINSQSQTADLVAALPAAPAGVARVFHLLKVHGLASDDMGGVTDSLTGPAVMVIQPSIVREIRSVLRGPGV